MENCNETLNNKPANTICEKYYNVNEAKDKYTFSGWKMGCHAIALGAPLFGMGALAQWRNGGEGG